MIKVLVTGATGLLGSSLVPYLKQCGYKVLTHAKTSQADFMFDLSDRKKTFEVLEKIKPSVIINLVGLTSVEVCEEKVNLAYLINTCTVENLANWIRETREHCHLIQISTDHVYDGPGLNAEDSVNITNNYALTKYAGELAAGSVSSTILRTNFVGRSKVNHRESLTDWVYNSMNCGKCVEVLDDIYFSPLSINVLVKLIEVVVQKKPGGIYNLGSHNGMSKADFDFIFAKFLNLPTETMKRIGVAQAIFLKAYRPRNMRMNNFKFEDRLGVKLPHLVDIIEEIASEYDEIT